MKSFLVALSVCLVLLSVQSSLGLKAKYFNQFTNNMKLKRANGVSTITATGLPDHEWQRVNPNSPKQKNFNYRVMSQPELSGKQVCVPHGPIALAKNGVALFNALTAPRDGNEDAVKRERFDSCQGHSTMDGTYHYHQLPGCVYKGTANEFVGVAFDGFPIFGPNVTDKNRLLRSSDLDECHGRTVNGEYRYHITLDFPYIIGCYKGRMLSGPGIRPGRKQCKNVKGKKQLCDCGVGSVEECDVAPKGDPCMDKNGKIRRK